MKVEEINMYQMKNHMLTYRDQLVFGLLQLEPTKRILQYLWLPYNIYEMSPKYATVGRKITPM